MHLIGSSLYNYDSLAQLNYFLKVENIINIIILKHFYSLYFWGETHTILFIRRKMGWGLKIGRLKCSDVIILIGLTI